MKRRLTLRNILIFTGILAVTILYSTSATAQMDPAAPVQAAAPAFSLWELAKAGGFMMIVLVLMSVGGLSLMIYNFQTLKLEKMVPAESGNRLIELLERSDESGVRKWIANNPPNIFSRIVLAGLSKKRRGPVFVRESMESAARQEIGKMWQQISYLADLGSIGPLVGLFGTVIGMVQAFSSIAFQAGSVKPVLLIGGVSKAMVSTAGGLLVAIPALLAYVYFKGAVIRITRVLENYTAEMIKVLEDRHEDFLGDTTYVKI